MESKRMDLCEEEIRKLYMTIPRVESAFRKTFSTHQRCTVVFRDEEDKVYHLRVSEKPESLHEDIYRKRGVPMLKNRRLTNVDHRL